MYRLFADGHDSYNTAAEKNFILQNYGRAENISIDYAIMETAENVFVVPAVFDWNDLGTWGSLHDKLPKDASNNTVVNARVFIENSSNNIIRAEKGKTVIIDGLNDYIVVDKEDILLIYPKEKEQEIKKITEIVTTAAKAEE